MCSGNFCLWENLCRLFLQQQMQMHSGHYIVPVACQKVFLLVSLCYQELSKTFYWYFQLLEELHVDMYWFLLPLLRVLIRRYFMVCRIACCHTRGCSISGLLQISICCGMYLSFQVFEGLPRLPLQLRPITVVGILHKLTLLLYHFSLRLPGGHICSVPSAIILGFFRSHKIAALFAQSLCHAQLCLRQSDLVHFCYAYTLRGSIVHKIKMAPGDLDFVKWLSFLVKKSHFCIFLQIYFSHCNETWHGHYQG